MEWEKKNKAESKQQFWKQFIFSEFVAGEFQV